MITVVGVDVANATIEVAFLHGDRPLRGDRPLDVDRADPGGAGVRRLAARRGG